MARTPLTIEASLDTRELEAQLAAMQTFLETTAVAMRQLRVALQKARGLK